METKPSITFNPDIFKSDIVAKSESKDGKAILEFQDFEKERKLLENQSIAQDIGERKKYAKWIFWMVCGWLIVILGIIIAVGLSGLKLTDTVIVSLITSTTINITAFFLAVTKYLFPNKGEQSSNT